MPWRTAAALRRGAEARVPAEGGSPAATAFAEIAGQRFSAGELAPYLDWPRVVATRGIGGPRRDPTLALSDHSIH